MNVLLLTNYFPTPLNPMGGIFITRRLERLKKYGIDYDAFGAVYDESSLLGVARTVLKKPKKEGFDDLQYIEMGNVRYNYIHVPIGLPQAAFIRLSPFSEPAMRAKYLFRSTDSKKYDLIHAHCIYPEGSIAFLAKSRYGIPCVLSAHGSDIHTLPHIRPKLKPLILQALESADRVIFVSNALLRKSMELGYDGENAVVIPNGVDTSLFSIMDKSEARRETGLSEAPTYCIGFVGNLVKVKGADRLPEIFLNIKNEISDARFLVVGDGNLRQSIQKKCSENGLEVLFTGIVNPDQVPLWMNSMNCLIIPSRNEGWGSVALEAQACGVPVVGSNVGGIPEAVGKGGKIVEEGEDFEERFAEAVCDILRNPPKPEKLRKRVSEYDWENIVRREVDVYRSLFS